jgi:hypothetical protein
MVSSYSTDLKLELMVTGENAGTMGRYYKYKLKHSTTINCWL